MTEDDRFRTLAGAYLVGLLDPEESAEFEVHSRECRTCREELDVIRALPAILRLHRPPLAEPDLLAAGIPSPGATTRSEGDKTNLALLVKREIHRRRRARVALLSVVGAVAAATLLVTVLLAPSRSVPSGQVMALRGTLARGTALLEAKGWGTQIVLSADRLPGGEVLVAVVYGPGGKHPVGSWSAPAGGRSVVELATSLHPPSIRRLVVYASSSDTVVLHS